LRNPHTTRVFDGLFVFYVVFWVVIGAWVGVRAYQLADVADQAGRTAQVLDHAGSALESLRGLPFVGNAPANLGSEVRQQASEISAQAASTSRGTKQLGVLLGLTVALAPSLPVAALYVPLRSARRREVRAVRRAYEAAPAGQVTPLDVLLAHRAAQHLAISDLAAVTDDPYGAIARGEYGPLVDAELRRLGLRESDDSAAHRAADRPPNRGDGRVQATDGWRGAGQDRG
jgi:hypothetical protein